MRHRQLGTGPDLERRREVRRALNGLLSRKRTWTAAQLAEALAEEKGIVMRPPTVRKYLHLMGASYRRTKYSLRHRQDPERAAAARTELDDFKKSPRRRPRPLLPGRNRLGPCLPPTHTWCRHRRRPEVPHESPQRRRVNVSAALAAPGPDRKAAEKTEKEAETETATAPPPLTWWAAARTWKGEDLVDFLRHALPPDRGVPRVVVMDNASFHHARKVREALPDLQKQNLHLYYLPPRPGTERHRTAVPQGQARGHAPAPATPRTRPAGRRARLLPGPPGPTFILTLVRTKGLV